LIYLNDISLIKEPLQLLGGSDAVKAVQCTHAQDRLVVVKIYVKGAGTGVNLDTYKRKLDRIRKQISILSKSSGRQPAIVPLMLIKETDKVPQRSPFCCFHVPRGVTKFLSSKFTFCALGCVHDSPVLCEQSVRPVCHAPFPHRHRKTVSLGSVSACLAKLLLGFALLCYNLLSLRSWISFQILKALQEMHSKDVYHGDLKAENVMMTSWGHVFLCDIGFYKPDFLPADDPTK
jgi:hypothetical protein